MNGAPVVNPLAIGVYRIDLPTEKAADFGRWRRAQRGKVQLCELENGPNGTARVSFAVLARPGAFPFGKLGKPTRGALVVGAIMPEWKDIVLFPLRQFPGAELALQVGTWANFFATRAGPEFAALRDAVTVARANLAVVRSQLELVRNGSLPNPGAVLADAAQTVKASVELLLTRAAAIPIAFPRALVNDAIKELTAVADAIAAAPGKALHALTDFASDAANKLAGPALLELGAVVLVGLGGLMAFGEKKVTPTSRNLMLAGAAAAFAGGFGAGINIFGPPAQKAAT
ncbi:MAG: hypothetical protein RLZZ373_2712 [Pseudomonadota bacterium]